MQLHKLFARAHTVLIASLLTAGTLVVIATPASAIGGTITQTSPTTGATTVDDSSVFTDQLSATGDGSQVTFATSASDPGLSVSPSGAVTTTLTLAVGTYSASGTDSDPDSDTGTWSYSLSVTASTLTQASPTSNSTTVNGSVAFSDQLNVSGNNGAVTYVTTATSPALTVSSMGAVTTTGQLLSGSYSVSGTDSDVDGDTGVWAYSLMVASPGGSSGGRTLVQTSATTGSTTAAASASFVPPPIVVANNAGAVTYTTTTSSPAFKVTSDGIITVTASLSVGTYTVSGTDQDVSGDSGTWTYTLTVAGTAETVIFLANGGKGSMAAQVEDQAAPLTMNAFTRKGYTFLNWSTSAKGTGTAYANGATYPFTTSLTLYARWKKGKVAFHKVTFFAHGGKGSMAVERENTATGLSSVKFTRKGYVFANWNTKATGKGVSFANHVTYSFKRNLSLYAQWRKKPSTPTKPGFTVTFVANGGTGVMASEKGSVPAALSSVTFTRAGYTFVSWNTKATGSGTKYTNRAQFPFSANVTLFAQWKKKAVAPPPAPPIVYGGLILGPFASGSSALSPALETQIRAIAEEVKSKSKTQISLLGFGDKLSGSNATAEPNVALGRDRAQAVADYLQTSLSALKLRGGWSISVGAEGTAKSSSGQIESALVQVSLS